MNFPLPQGPVGLLIALIVIAALLSLFIVRRPTRSKDRAQPVDADAPSVVDRMREEGLL